MTTNICNRYWERRRAGWYGAHVDALIARREPYGRHAPV
jgi:hypothetical protein